jgi:hypothetical protein
MGLQVFWSIHINADSYNHKVKSSGHYELSQTHYTLDVGV